MCLMLVDEVMCLLFVFKQKTAYEMRISDWSSDVCSSDLEQRAGPVLQADAQPRDAARSREVAQEHVREQPRVDIAAGEHESDLAPGKFLGMREHRREPRRARALDHPLFDLAQQAHRALEVPLDRKSTRLNSSH